MGRVNGWNIALVMMMNIVSNVNTPRGNRRAIKMKGEGEGVDAAWS